MADNKKKPNSDVETVEPMDSSRSRKVPAELVLTVAHHPDPARVGERLRLFADSPDRPLGLSRLEPVFWTPEGDPTRPLETAYVSRKPIWLSRAAGGGVRLMPEPGGGELAVGGQPVLAERTLTAAELARGVVLVLARRVALLLHSSPPVERCARRLDQVGESAVMEALRATLVKVADQRAPVLLVGESGAGKELAARAIHTTGPRRKRPFVCVNLAAVPASTAASELFGHAAGAFTGATGEHRGFFQQADGGSLFIDEVGTSSPELQAMLLRVIESGEIQAVGAKRIERVDVRVLAASDEDLVAAIAAGRFRAPLYHRLSACRVELPALRERKDDIGRLLVHFLVAELTAVGRLDRLREDADSRPAWLSAELVARLIEQPWPGNVRQLHNVARQMVIGYAEAETVDAQAILAGLDAAEALTAGPPLPAPVRTAARPAEIDPDELVAAMRAHRFNIKACAAALGMSRSSLYALIERSPDLRTARDIGHEELEACLRECGRDIDALAERLEVSARALGLRLKELGL